MVRIYSESELQFLQNKDLSDYAPGFSIINIGEYLFRAYGVREDNIITRIELNKETFELEGFGAYLYIPEWQALEELLSFNIIKDCEFSVEGIIKRRGDGTGTLDVISIVTK